jgi:hypothetical protein
MLVHIIKKGADVARTNGANYKAAILNLIKDGASKASLGIESKKILDYGETPCSKKSLHLVHNNSLSLLFSHSALLPLSNDATACKLLISHFCMEALLALSKQHITCQISY